MGGLANLARDAVNAAIEDWSEITEPTWKEVQLAAQNFLSGYEELETENKFSTNEFNIINEIIDTQIENNNTIDINKLNTIRKQLTNDKRDNKLRAVYLLAFKYQNLYQKALDITPSEVNYVSNTGDVYKTTLQWLALTAGKGGRISQTLGTEQFYTEQLQWIEQTQKDQLSNLMSKVNEFFDNIEIAFANRTKDEKLKSGYFFERNGQIVLSRNKAYIKTKDGLISRVLNKGDLNEGYLRSIYSSTSILEGLKKVDNEGAVLFEDIYDAINNINIAGKSNKAALPGLKQYKLEAEMIVANTKQQIIDSGKTEIKNDESQVRNLINMTAEEIFNQTGDRDLFNEFGIDLIGLIPEL